MYISDQLIDSLILDDVPYGDLTTDLLGIGDKPGRIEYFSREPGILCCTEEAAAMMRKIGLTDIEFLPSGTRIVADLDGVAAAAADPATVVDPASVANPMAPADAAVSANPAVVATRQTFLSAHGTAEQIHTAWKCCLNVLDNYSGTATRAREFVDAVHAENPLVSVLTTRKGIPGTKALANKALRVGGAYPHRLGLSETVLVFDHHIAFMGGMDAFIAKLPQIKAHSCEKKVIVEAGLADAERLAAAGVDGIQFDKVPAKDIKGIAVRLRELNPAIILLGAGGINVNNAASYAACGIDGIVTSSLYHVKPLDMSVRIIPE